MTCLGCFVLQTSRPLGPPGFAGRCKSWYYDCYGQIQYWKRGTIVKRSGSFKNDVRIVSAVVFVCFAASLTFASATTSWRSLVPVSIRDVNVTDQFWAPRMELNRTMTIPHIFKMMEQTGTIDKFVCAAGPQKGKASKWWNTDEQVYKTIEGASFSLMQSASLQRDQQLDKTIDELIVKIAAAQQPDGYLHTQKIINLQLSPDATPRWADLGGELELYLAGHLYEAAVAHFQATGKLTLLGVAVKNAGLVAELFGPDKRHDVCGHPEIELALVKLYKTTGDKKYLDLARFFIEQRGRADGRKLRGSFSQDHKPIVEQTEAVGQARRAAYLYSGVTDLAIITADANYTGAMETLWKDVVQKKMYITGGIGSRHENEGFSEPYELPNKTACTETCAAVGFSMWNHRMFLLTGEGKYIDALERTIYNNFLAGVSLGGDQFFYVNPLESDGQWQFNRGPVTNDQGTHKEGSATRKEWFLCACCPPNVARFLPAISQFIYATDGNEIFVNLFIGSTAAIKLKDSSVSIMQETRYPWDGYVKLTVSPQRSQDFAIKLRIPGWARGWPVPSDLYYYLDPVLKEITLKVNGQAAALDMHNGFTSISRTWNKGDVIELNLPMRVRRVLSHKDVKENTDKVALERGPLVYCAEGKDNNGRALNIVVSDKAELQTEHRADLLGGVTVIRGRVYALLSDPDSKSALISNHSLTAIPYYAWSNRGAGEMVVWFRRSLPASSGD